MKIFNKIFLILVLVLTTLCTNPSYSTQKMDVLSQGATITAPKTHEKDFINSRNNEFSLNAINNNESSICTRRNNDNSNTNSNNASITQIKDFKNIITFNNLQLNLDDKNELALLFLLHQIQPKKVILSDLCNL